MSAITKPLENPVHMDVRVIGELSPAAALEFNLRLQVLASTFGLEVSGAAPSAVEPLNVFLSELPLEYGRRLKYVRLYGVRTVAQYMRALWDGTIPCLDYDLYRIGIVEDICLVAATRRARKWVEHNYLYTGGQQWLEQLGITPVMADSLRDGNPDTGQRWFILADFMEGTTRRDLLGVSGIGPRTLQRLLRILSSHGVDVPTT